MLCWKSISSLSVIGGSAFGYPTTLMNYTVATLPAASGLTGAICYVTDALAPTYNATVVGGGAVKTLVFSNGTNWTCH